jgi:hypothetical protein
MSCASSPTVCTADRPHGMASPCERHGVRLCRGRTSGSPTGSCRSPRPAPRATTSTGSSRRAARGSSPRSASRACASTSPRGPHPLQNSIQRSGHVCTGTGLAPTPDIHWDKAYARHICTGTGHTRATSAPGLGPAPPRLHRDWAPPSTDAHCSCLARGELDCDGQTAGTGVCHAALQGASSHDIPRGMVCRRSRPSGRSRTPPSASRRLQRGRPRYPPTPTATSASRLGSPLPHLHRDWARPCHICIETELAPATSAPGLGPPLPHLHLNWARP